MNPERWDRIKELFAAASELPAAEQSGYLDRRCADDHGLRAEVERLLGGANKPGARILEAGAPPDLIRDVLGGPSPLDARTPPERIDHYRVIRVLGEGGMGRVYLAEQTAPVQRQVALKVIRVGMDSRQVLERFAAERLSVARMEHDSIARVYDAGTTESGQPYFVMEYVPGLPITRFCDEHRFDSRQRLELFAEVCRGVQHAHHKGVIHRDLKPSNILVSVQEGKAVPKIIDFGIAKATGPGIPGTTTGTPEPLTVAGLMVGTPEYMSPEQAGGPPADVDTRTDVYALGVVLYELLTGELPIARGELLSQGVGEMHRKLREDDPPRPSTRVSSMGAAGEAVVARRQATRSSLVRALRGDLDWITMRALEKDRNRRYATPFALAEDIQRHLHDEPLAAGPPGAAYRIGKFVRRHRIQVIAGAALLLTLLAGIASTTFFMVQERDARRESETNLANFDLLATVVNLREAREALEDESLYPAWPDRSAALRAWIRERGEPLEQRLPAIGYAVQSLRARAGAADPGGGGGRLPRFADAADQFLHDTLVELSGDLRSFLDPRVGELARTRARLAWSVTIRDRSITTYRERWHRAREAVAGADGVTASRFYAGRIPDLEPQLGLVPIGMNPVTGLWEFYHLASATNPDVIPAHDADGDIPVEEGTGIVFVLVPGGEFLMGAQAADPERPNYDPQVKPHESTHHAAVGPFFLARHELTQGQWLRLSGGTNPSTYGVGWDRPDDDAPPVTLANPVDGVSWEVSRRLLVRHGLDLPTEAQWEFACRAGSETPWSTGRDRTSLVGHANLLDATAGRAVSQWGVPEDHEDGFIAHAPVGRFRPNAFGFFDMHGNIWEWVRGEPESPNAFLVRGGGFTADAEDARSALRLSTPPNTVSGAFGVRAARPLRE